MMNSETIVLILLFLPLLVLQCALVTRLVQHLPKLVEQWHSEAGKLSNSLLNESEQLKLLDSRFLGAAGYEALKRLGFTSPLFGVAATAILILTRSDIASDANSLGDLKLLFSGVLGGAVLAITNQACLWYVNYRFQGYRQSAKLPIGSQNLFRSVEDFRTRLENSVTDASERSSLLITMLEELFCTHNESLLLRIGEMDRLHEAVQETMGNSRDDVKNISSAIADLTSNLNGVNEKLESLHADSLPELSDVLKGVKENAEKLSSDVGALSSATEEAKTKFGEASESIEKSGKLIHTATDSLALAAQEMRNTSAAVANKWSNFSTQLEELGREKLTPQLKELVSNMTEQVRASKEASDSIATASTKLRESLDTLGDKIASVKDVGEDVSSQVGKAMTELNGSIRSTVQSHNKMLVNWRQVLDLIPKSFESHADGVVKGLISELSELFNRNHEIMSSVHEVLEKVDQK